MGQLTRGQTVGIVALLVVVTGWVGVTALHTDHPASPPGIVVRESLPAYGSSPSVPPAISSGSMGAAPVAPTVPGTSGTEIVVHVAGAVKKPGVYHLQPGARNDDAIRAAGGFTGAANPDAINLAAHSEDGSQLYVPNRSEQALGGAAPQRTVSASSAPSISPADAPSSAKSAKGAGRGSSRSSGKFSDPSQGQVNLNTADAAQLQHIPGIGPAMAERILTYRRSAGRFQSPDDLLQISGIGDKKYQRMKPYMTVR